MQSPESILNAELGDSEQLLWAGQPKQGVTFRASDIIMVPFSLMWGGGAMLIAISALSAVHFVVNDTDAFVGLEGGASVVILASVVSAFVVVAFFVLVGLYMSVGRFIVDSKRRARTFYGLSDQRVIVVSGLFIRTVKSMNLRTLSDVSLSEKADRTGTIAFGPSQSRMSWVRDVYWPVVPRAGLFFEMIPDAKKVYDQVVEVQSST